MMAAWWRFGSRRQAWQRPDPSGKSLSHGDADRFRDFCAQPPSRALLDVVAERRRQVEVEGFDAAHDDAYRGGELARAAGCYALNASGIAISAIGFWFWWPWAPSWWKPANPRRDLVRAGALILADRAADAAKDAA